MIAVLDYNAGNLASVYKAFKFIGCEAKVTSAADEIAMAAALVLPGVGSMADAMENLEKTGMDKILRDFAYSGKPLLGICLGMQMLFEYSSEGFGISGETVKGLGILKGKVSRFPDSLPVKIPHMGWNTIKDIKDDILKENTDVYFVHSYYVEPDDKSIATSYAFHGKEFASSVKLYNVRATQFHPEKSGDEGINILRRWVRTI